MKLVGVSLACLMSFGLLLVPASRSQAQAGQMEHAHAPAIPSTGLTLTIDGNATTISVADLKAMSQKTVTVHNEHLKVDETYTGVSLSDLLAKDGFPVDKSTHQKMLRSYIKAEGTDKYWVLYSATEIEPSEHNADVIVATTLGGKPLGEDGQIKLVSTADKKPQRWVRNLTAITAKTAD